MVIMTDRLRALCLAGALACAGLPAARADGQAPGSSAGAALNSQIALPNGQVITPLAASGAVLQTLDPHLPAHPDFRAGGAISMAVSPDRQRLVVMTSGFNKLFKPLPPSANSYRARKPVVDAGDEYLFLYDISGSAAAAPKPLQVVKLPQSFPSLAFSPDGKKLYASGGAADGIFVFVMRDGRLAANGTIALGHASFAKRLRAAEKPFAHALGSGIGIATAAMAGGLAVSPDGRLLLAANTMNDSVSLIDTARRRVLWEADLRPFRQGRSGTPGGETPFGVALAPRGDGTLMAYAASLRDREIVVLPARSHAPAPQDIQRIPLSGNPNMLVLDAARRRLYAPQDNADRIAVIDTSAVSLSAQWPATPQSWQPYGGAAPNQAAINPDGSRLYVSLGGSNAVAVIDTAHGDAGPIGLIPTGWYPHAVALGGAESAVYAGNGRSIAGPNPREADRTSGQYVLQLSQGALLSMPLPAPQSLAGLSAQVAANNHITGAPLAMPAQDQAKLAFLRAHIHHVVYVLKENRTFDQVLGDLGNGANGDPSLAMFPQAVTPNLHALARGFVTLDNFFCAGQVSGNGWPWSTAARETDYGVKTIPMVYARRGFADGAEGTARNVNVAMAAPARAQAYLDPDGDGEGNAKPASPDAARAAPRGLYAALDHALPGGMANMLPGSANEFAANGPAGTPRERGFLWDGALRAGVSVRNYGFMLDISRYELKPGQGGVALARDAFAHHTQMAWPANTSLAPLTDLYFRGFDNLYPDLWRIGEWQREFAGFAARGDMPGLMLVRLMHDHMGDFCAALPPYDAPGCPAGGLNTPDLQQADNDYATGLLVQSIAHSRFAGDTLIVVLEDDSQNGPDHVDAQRSTAYFAGAFVRQGAVVSTRYSTVDALRTMESVLGIAPLNLNDAHARAMLDLFDPAQTRWSYQAVVPGVLKQSLLGAELAQISDHAMLSAPPPARPHGDGAWWAAATRGFDFSAEDRMPAASFNRVLWQGLMAAPLPPSLRAQ